MWSWMKSTSSKTPHWHSNVSLDSSWLVFKVQEDFLFCLWSKPKKIKTCKSISLWKKIVQRLKKKNRQLGARKIHARKKLQYRKNKYGWT
jgi:hypothetical protein